MKRNYGADVLIIFCALLLLPVMHNRACAQSVNALLFWEIRLSVVSGDQITVTVTNMETGLNVPLFNNFATMNDPWVADTDNAPASYPAVDADLTDRTLYKLSYSVVGKSEIYEYLYYACPTQVPQAGEKFFCPKGPVSNGNADIEFIYTGADMIVEMVGIYNQTNTDVNAHYPGGNWILPYNISVYCTSGAGVPSLTCEPGVLAYFLTPQTDKTTFLTSDIDFIVPAGYTYNWDDDITLKFGTSKKLEIYGILNISGPSSTSKFTLTSKGANWGGIEFKNGSEGLLQNVDVLKVGSGAYTGAMTIRSGADVTIEDSDQIILGPTFVAELGSTFTARIVPGLSTAPPGPQPDLMGEPLLAVEEVLGAVSYPNPFNPRTTIRFTLAGDAPVTITVFNILGQEVATLVDEPRAAGVQEVVWDVRETSGMSLPSGVYVYRIQAGDQIETGHMVLAK
jgi:hypothetical protein